MPRPQYEALNSQGFPYMRLAQVIDELATPEERITALKEAGAEISDLLQLPLLKPINYGTPAHLAFGLTRNQAKAHAQVKLLLTHGCDVPLQFTESWRNG